MSNVDWEKLKAEYLHGGTSYRKLAEKYGISRSLIQRRATREHWADLEEDVRAKAESKVCQKIASDRASDLAKLDRTRSLLIEKLSRAAERYPDVPGNRMEQSVSERDDGKGGEGGSKFKTVKTESDLIKMVGALEKLMAMTGYAPDAGSDEKVVIVDDV